MRLTFTEEKERKKKRGPEEDTTSQRMERERVRYAEIERERAKKRLQKRMEADRCVSVCVTHVHHLNGRQLFFALIHNEQ